MSQTARMTTPTAAAATVPSRAVKPVALLFPDVVPVPVDVGLD